MSRVRHEVLIQFVEPGPRDSYGLREAVWEAANIVTELDRSLDRRAYCEFFQRKFIFGWPSANFTMAIDDDQYEVLRISTRKIPILLTYLNAK
jgi:hypothetical protein